MEFKKAFDLMKQGMKMKLPSWGGYWYWDDEKKTVIMHTKDGQELDIRETERVIYTLSNILDDGWVLADEENCPELGGEATFGFDEADIAYFCKDWEKYRGCCIEHECCVRYSIKHVEE